MRVTHQGEQIKEFAGVRPKAAAVDMDQIRLAQLVAQTARPIGAALCRDRASQGPDFRQNRGDHR